MNDSLLTLKRVNQKDWVDRSHLSYAVDYNQLYFLKMLLRLRIVGYQIAKTLVSYATKYQRKQILKMATSHVEKVAIHQTIFPVTFTCL